MCVLTLYNQCMLLSSLPNVPLLQLLHFSSNWSEISYICQVSPNLQDGIIYISQGHHMRAQFNTIMSKMGKKYTNMTHCYVEAINYEITSGNAFCMW